MRLKPWEMSLNNLAQKTPTFLPWYTTREVAYERLKHVTGQDFGYDVEAWRQWCENAPEPFPNRFKPIPKPSLEMPFIFNKETNLGSFERINGIAFCGENPQIILYGNEREDYTAAASYWRSVYSPVGEGNVLLLYLDDANSDEVQHPNYSIYSDNPKLADYLNLTFNQHFDEFKHLNFASVKSQEAKFAQDSDSRNFHKVHCETENHTIELFWADVRLRQLFILKDLNEGGFGKDSDEHYDVYTNIFLCNHASIKINGKELNGTIRTRQDGNIFRSSAFMAFSETWIKRT